MHLLRARTLSVIGVLAMLRAAPAMAKPKLDRQIEQTVATGEPRSDHVVDHRAGLDAGQGGVERRRPLARACVRAVSLTTDAQSSSESD